MANKRMTKKYWHALSVESRHRALWILYHGSPASDWYAKEDNPNLKDDEWRYIFRKIKIPDDCSHYKTVINKTYIP